MNEFLRNVIFYVFMFSVSAILFFAFFVLTKIADFIEVKILYQIKNMLNRVLK